MKFQKGTTRGLNKLSSGGTHLYHQHSRAKDRRISLKFEPSLVCRARSRTDRATQKNLPGKTKGRGGSILHLCRASHWNSRERICWLNLKMPLGERKLKETEDMKQNKNKTKKPQTLKRP